MGETLLVDADLEGRRCKFVVDTGSNITIVRPDLVETLTSGKIVPTKTVLRTVTGETAPVRGRGKLKITVGNSLTEHDVWLADIVEEGIIGLDYLMANNCQVDLARKVLHIGNDEVRLFNQVQSAVNGLSRIVVRRTIAIPAMSEAIIPGKLDKCGERNAWAAIGPVDNTHRKLLVARTLVDLSAEDLPVRVMNLTNGYVSLKKGAEIALCEPIGCGQEFGTSICRWRR